MKIFSFCFVILITFLAYSVLAEDEKTWTEVFKVYGIKNFDGAEVLKVGETKYDEVEFSEAIKIKGRLVRVLYYIPTASSSVEIADNYIDELVPQGFETVSNIKGGAEFRISQYIECNKNVGICGDSYKDGAELDTENKRVVILKKNLEPGKDLYLKIAVATFAEGKAGVIKSTDNKVVKEVKAGSYVLVVNLVIPKGLTKKMVEDVNTIAQRLAEAGKVNLYGIYFDFNQDLVKDESAPVLESVAQVLKNDLSLKLVVVGHTDNVGSNEYNLNLSSKRSEAVVAKLVKNYGIGSERLSSVGKGSTEPIIENNTEENRAKNRRVELKKLN